MCEVPKCKSRIATAALYALNNHRDPCVLLSTTSSQRRRATTNSPLAVLLFALITSTRRSPIIMIEEVDLVG